MTFRIRVIFTKEQGGPLIREFDFAHLSHALHFSLEAQQLGAAVVEPGYGRPIVNDSDALHQLRLDLRVIAAQRERPVGVSPYLAGQYGPNHDQRPWDTPAEATARAKLKAEDEAFDPVKTAAKAGVDLGGNRLSAQEQHDILHPGEKAEIGSTSIAPNVRKLRDGEA
jgi:hypothetical protein